MTSSPATGSGRDALLEFLRTDDIDAGCEQTRALMHVYAEVALSGRDPEIEHPGITAHLQSCGPCADDFDGLMAVVEATTQEQ